MNALARKNEAEAKRKKIQQDLQAQIYSKTLATAPMSGLNSFTTGYANPLYAKSY
jgi:hypothetical protein